MLQHSIIIVEDDEDDRELIDMAFKANGYKDYLLFACPLDLLKYLDKSRELPRIIITDYNMPGLTGLQLLKILKADDRYQHIRVIIFSTAHAGRQEEECIKEGALEFLTKPCLMSGYSTLTQLILKYS